MTKKSVIRELEIQQMKNDIPRFNVGDTVRVHTRIIEGDKERVQVFTGTVIARKGTGLTETFSVHRVAYGEGMERVFLLHSPRIAKVEVVKEGKVRRAKLYHLRGKTGKSARVKSRLGVGRKKIGGNGEEAPQEPLEEEKDAAEVDNNGAPYVKESEKSEEANSDNESTAHRNDSGKSAEYEEEKADA